jgi:hypothetical protein
MPKHFDPRYQSQPLYDPMSVWWRWQHLLDLTKDVEVDDFINRAALIRARFDALEEDWARKLPNSRDIGGLTEFSLRCCEEACAAAADLIMGFGVDERNGIDPRWAPSVRTVAQ